MRTFFVAKLLLPTLLYRMLLCLSRSYCVNRKPNLFTAGKKIRDLFAIENGFIQDVFYSTVFILTLMSPS